MGVKRRYFVGGASALAVSSGSSAAFAENKDPVRGPTLISAAADPADFEAALRSKFSTGDVLNWRGGNVRLKHPIQIDVTESMIGPGVDLNGAKVIADFNDATRRAITIRIPGSSKNVALRGMKFFNGSIIAESPAQDALGLVCLTNQSWIYSWKIMNLDIEQFARDGLFFAGCVAEGECHAVTCASNGRNGMTFRNDGPKDDTGIVSAISIFGGQMRKNGTRASRRRATSRIASRGTSTFGRLFSPRTKALASMRLRASRWPKAAASTTTPDAASIWRTRAACSPVARARTDRSLIW